MKRPIYVISFIFITIIALAIAQVSVSNQISTTGAELSEWAAQVDDYKRENVILQEELLAVASFTNIAAKAENLGYVEATNNLSLTEPLPLALR